MGKNSLNIPVHTVTAKFEELYEDKQTLVYCIIFDEKST